MNTYSDLTEHPLEEQHALAYEVFGTLSARGFRPSMGIGGGGILEVTAPLVVPNRDNGHQIRFSSYVEDTIFVEQELEDGYFETVWYLPSKLITPDRRPWVHVEDFVNELNRELGEE